MKRAVRRIFIAGASAWALLAAELLAQAADPFKLTSSTLEDNAPLAVKNAGNNKQNPNCVGENVSPPLAWANPPAGTTSYALIMYDPEGRGGLGVVHWVAYGIPASVTGFAEAETSKLTNSYVGGKSMMGVGFYSGPCTPPNTTPHHYTFILTATDFEPNELPPGLTRDEVIAKFGSPSPHTKGSTGMVGLFVNPWHD